MTSEVRIDIVDMNPPVPDPAPDQEKRSRRRRVLVKIGSGVLILACVSFLAGLIIYIDSSDNFPQFQLDSVSVSVDNITAVWDISFSIDRSVGPHQVSARFMSREYKAEPGGGGGGSNATVSVSTLLSGPLAGDGGGGLTLEQVAFKCSNYQDRGYRYVLEAACKDIQVTSPHDSAAARLTMKGGPRLCRLVYHNRTEIRRVD